MTIKELQNKINRLLEKGVPLNSDISIYVCDFDDYKCIDDVFMDRGGSVTIQC